MALTLTLDFYHSHATERKEYIQTMSRACSSVAKGFALEPGLASDQVGDTSKSALAAKQNSSAKCA